MPNKVTFKLETTLVHIGEGRYRTYPSTVFEGKAYEEGDILEFLAPIPKRGNYPPPGSVIVPVTASWAVFEAIDDAQSGNSEEREEPGEWRIIEESVHDADTGEPIDPTQV